MPEGTRLASGVLPLALIRASCFPKLPKMVQTCPVRYHALALRCTSHSCPGHCVTGKERLRVKGAHIQSRRFNVSDARSPAEDFTGLPVRRGREPLGRWTAKSCSQEVGDSDPWPLGSGAGSWEAGVGHIWGWIR